MGVSEAVRPLEVADRVIVWVQRVSASREIWDDGGGVIGGGCQECHSLDGSEKTVPPFEIAPTWLGVSLRAGDRVPGLSAEEYLRESIVDPAAYIVEGYSDHMPKGFRFLLSEEDIDSLIAFILTQ